MKRKATPSITPHYETVERNADESQMNWATYLFAKWMLNKYLAKTQTDQNPNHESKIPQATGDTDGKGMGLLQALH